MVVILLVFVTLLVDAINNVLVKVIVVVIPEIVHVNLIVHVIVMETVEIALVTAMAIHVVIVVVKEIVHVIAMVIA